LKAEIAYLGLGSNMGDRRKHIADAVDMLKNTDGVVVNAVSPLYETKPEGYTEQADFLNCAAEILTTLCPLDLLAACMRIEDALGRRRVMKWGPRTADLDILFYGDLITESEGLTLPHPLLHERIFVLLPLTDIAPDKIHPILKVSILELYKNIDPSGLNRPAAYGSEGQEQPDRNNQEGVFPAVCAPTPAPQGEII
jgi:2-amino-4-hydroxy-6-hydroxymethyldihydropteridine diphosphokinase